MLYIKHKGRRKNLFGVPHKRPKMRGGFLPPSWWTFRISGTFLQKWKVLEQKVSSILWKHGWKQDGEYASKNMDENKMGNLSHRVWERGWKGGELGNNLGLSQTKCASNVLEPFHIVVGQWESTHFLLHRQVLLQGAMWTRAFLLSQSKEEEDSERFSVWKRASSIQKVQWTFFFVESLDT
jgi:hypothetical protein